MPFAHTFRNHKKIICCFRTASRMAMRASESIHNLLISTRSTLLAILRMCVVCVCVLICTSHDPPMRRKLHYGLWAATVATVATGVTKSGLRTTFSHRFSFAQYSKANKKSWKNCRAGEKEWPRYRFVPQSDARCRFVFQNLLVLVRVFSAIFFYQWREAYRLWIYIKRSGSSRESS